METVEKISANKPLYRSEFHFHDDHLAYFGDNWDFRVRYEHLPPVTQHKTFQKKERFTSAALLYCILAALALLLKDKSPHYGAAGFHWLMLAAGKFLTVTALVVIPVYLLERRGYTAIPTPKGNILLTQGPNHDRIVDRMQEKRVAALRRLFAAADPANTPEEEMAKFKWLKFEGVISEEEYAGHVRRLGGGG